MTMTCRRSELESKGGVVGSTESILTSTTPALRATPPRPRRGVWLLFRLYVQSRYPHAGSGGTWIVVARVVNEGCSSTSGTVKTRGCPLGSNGASYIVTG